MELKKISQFNLNKKKCKILADSDLLKILRLSKNIYAKSISNNLLKKNYKLQFPMLNKQNFIP
ncbi:hypothetical protein A2335_00205 [Candidatus Peregrinibacteria bacterium RIFOXYB2_FULL_32_7]|nr:MAG: hypothetical protein A2335_00205 [Candidatus Peregrinibacteria bacterium RIFOXYB2_FULL_32_7]